MIKDFFATILAGVLALTGLGATHETVVVNTPQPVEQTAPSLGTALPTATAVFETSLAAPITSAATSMTLSANSVRGGGSLSGYTCFTLDEGSAQAEYVCGNVATTTVTSLSRGISPADGTTEVTALKFAHRRGTNVKITDFPLVQRLKAQNNGDGTFENVLSYASGVTPSGLDQIADVGYVLSAITGTTSIATDRLIVAGIAGETISVGQVVYFDTNTGKWLKASALTTASSTRVQLGIAQGAGTLNLVVANGILLRGYEQHNGTTAGAFLYLSNTAGATSTTAGTVSVVLGQAKDTSTMYFDFVYANVVQTTVANTFAASTTFNATTTFNGAAIFNASTTISKTFILTIASGTSQVVIPVGKKATFTVVGAGGSGGEARGASTAANGGDGGCVVKFSVYATSSPLTLTASTSLGIGGAPISRSTAGSDSGNLGGTTTLQLFLGNATSTITSCGGVGGGADSNTSVGTQSPISVPVMNIAFPVYSSLGGKMSFSSPASTPPTSNMYTAGGGSIASGVQIQGTNTVYGKSGNPSTTTGTDGTFGSGGGPAANSGGTVTSGRGGDGFIETIID